MKKTVAPSVGVGSLTYLREHFGAEERRVEHAVHRGQLPAPDISAVTVPRSQHAIPRDEGGQGHSWILTYRS